jgi:hypothetical protein
MTALPGARDRNFDRYSPEVDPVFQFIFPYGTLINQRTGAEPDFGQLISVAGSKHHHLHGLAAG